MKIDYLREGDSDLSPHPVFGILYSGTQGKNNFMPYGNAPGWRKYYLLLKKPEFSGTPALRIRTDGVSPLPIHSIKLWPATDAAKAPPITRDWGY
jgi:hypothetical protein